MDKNYYQDEELEEFEEFEDFEDLEQELENDEDGEAVWDKERDRRTIPKRHRGLKIIAGIFIILAVAVGVVIYGFRLEEVRVIGNKNGR